MSGMFLILVLVNQIYLIHGGISLILEPEPAPGKYPRPDYRTPEAGLRYLGNGSYDTERELRRNRPAKFIIDGADAQAINAKTPSTGSLSAARPAAAGHHRPTGNQNVVKLAIHLIKLTNDGGITSQGKPCDLVGACDVVCHIGMDFTRPNDPYPGGAKKFIQLQSRALEEANSPALDVVFPGTTCIISANPYREASARVYCEDSDGTHSHAELINQWSCLITQAPAMSEGAAQWSGPADCFPVFQAGKIRLTYKYKVYFGYEPRCTAT